MLNNVWWSSHTEHASSSRSTIALLYESECWQMTETDLTTPKVWEKILHILWPQTICNKDLHIQCKLECIFWYHHHAEMMEIGRSSGERERDSVRIQHFTEGRHKHGRPKNTWQCTVKTEMRILGTAGTASKSWLGTDSCGGPLLLPCVSEGIKGNEMRWEEPNLLSNEKWVIISVMPCIQWLCFDHTCMILHIHLYQILR